MALGTAFHKAVELYWVDVKNGSREPKWQFYISQALADLHSAIAKGEVDIKDKEVEEINRDLIDAVTAYINECPDGIVPIDAEKAYKTAPTLDLPLPLKVKTDLYGKIDRHGHVVFDWKTVGEFTPEGVRPASYDIIAGATYLVFTTMGFPIDKMIFHETRKRAISPFRGMLKPDLLRLAGELNVPLVHNDTVEKIKTKLMDSGHIEIPSRTNVIVYDFHTDDGETHECIHLFLALYERIVREITGQPLYDPVEGSITFLPNPFDMLRGDESWLDFTDEVLKNRRWNISWVRGGAQKVKSEVLDNYDLDNLTE